MTDAETQTGVALAAETPEAAAAAAAHEPSLAQIEAHPLREILVIAAPAVASMASHTLMSLVDGLMVSRIGPDPVYVAAQGNGGVATWLVMSLMLGVGGVVSTFVSQHLGAGRPKDGAAYAWNGVWLCLISWAVLALPAAAAIGSVFRLFGHGGELLRLETVYAQIMLAAGSLVILAGRTLGQYFYGIHRPMVVLAAALVANAANVVINAVLIFGDRGLDPAVVAEAGPGPMTAAVGWLAGLTAPVASLLGIGPLGLAGAAIGTVLGALVELLIPAAVFLSPRFRRRFGTLAAWRPDPGKMLAIVRLGWPAGVQMVSELACWSYLLAVLTARSARLAAANEAGVPTDHPDAVEAGVTATAAGWIALRYMHLSFMPVVGVSMALTAVVGKCMGMGRPDLARSRSLLGLWLGVGYMALCGLGFVVFRGPMIGAFVPETTPDAAGVVAIGGTILIAAAVFQVFDAMQIVLMGALRGAGDTVVPGIIAAAGAWLMIVGLGHALLALRPGIGVVGPWAGAAVSLATIGVALLIRFLAGGWQKIELVRSPDAGAGPPTQPAAGPEPLPATPDRA